MNTFLEEITTMTKHTFMASLIGLVMLAAIAVKAQTLDAFNPNADLPVYQAVKLPDGKLLICGNFVHIGGASVPYLARLNPDGTRDTTFVSPVPSSIVNQIVPQPDGKFILTGGFDTIGGLTRRRIARLNADLTVDPSFDAGITSGNGVYHGALLPDGKFVVSIVNNFSRDIYRLNTDGSIDNTFSSPTLNSAASKIRYDPLSNKLYAIGGFTIVDGTQREGVMRLNLNGTVDTSFQSLDNGPGVFFGIEILPNGKVYVAGTMTNIAGEVGRNYVARLNSNGTLDTTFAAVSFGPGINPGVNAIEVLPSGKLLIAGAFPTVNSQDRMNMARLNSDGTLDTTFRNMIVGTTASSFNGPASLDPLGDGRYYVGGSFISVDGQTRNRIASITMADEIVVGPTAFDHDGDGKADLGVFRPGNQTWYVQRSSDSSLIGATFGLATDIPTPADFDGDGKTDIAVWRDESADPDKANFYILNSSDSTVATRQFGRTGDDPTIVGDYTGDGKADLAVYRAGAPGQQSYFYYQSVGSPPNTWVVVPWGVGGDKPAAGDFTGDGSADFAVFRPSSGIWYTLANGSGSVTYTQWGISSDKIVPADYDGDSKTDVAVYRNGTWYILRSSDQGVAYAQWGLDSDIPTPADYDGDGKADVAVYRAGVWWLNRSTSGVVAQAFGVAGDAPLPSLHVK